MAYDFQESLVNNLTLAKVQHIQVKVTVDMLGLVKGLEHTNLGLVSLKSQNCVFDYKMTGVLNFVDLVIFQLILFSIYCLHW